MQNNIGDEIGRLYRNIRATNPELIEAAIIQDAFNQSMPPYVRKHTKAVFVVPNTNSSEVIAYVDESLVSAECNMNAELFRIDINTKIFEIKNPRAELEDGQMFSVANMEYVKKLKFAVSKYAHQEKEEALSTQEQLEKETNTNRRNLSQEEIENIKEQVSVIEDEELREAVFKAACADARRINR